MTTRPLIFTGESVRSILAGRKTMTRRLIGKRPVKWSVGDHVWVKETWGLHAPFDLTDWHMASLSGADSCPPNWELDYRCEWAHPDGCFWRSPLYMPRWASRITLEVTGVRAEHLHDMPKADVYAEGITEEYVGHFCEWYGSQAPWMAFANKWNELHGHRAPWSSNPLVTVITFRRIVNA